MSDFQEQCQTAFRATVSLSLFSSKRGLIKQLDFCDIRNNQGLGDRHLPRP